MLQPPGSTILGHFFGTLNLNPVNLILTKLGKQVEESHLEIICKLVSLGCDGSVLHPPEPLESVPVKITAPVILTGRGSDGSAVYRMNPVQGRDIRVSGDLPQIHLQLPSKLLCCSFVNILSEQRWYFWKYVHS